MSSRVSKQLKEPHPFNSPLRKRRGGWGVRFLFSKELYPVVLAVLIFAFHGCGKKPVPAVPIIVTAHQVLQVIEKRAARIQDFSGRAYAVMSARDESQNAVVYINYRKPDRYRAILKGAFGVELADMTGEGDSVTVYVPSLKGYFHVGIDDNDLLEALAPGVSFDFSLDKGLKPLVSFLTGSLPRGYNDSGSHISLKRVGNRAVVTIEDGAARYRYTVEGPDLLLFEEEFFRDGELIMRIGYSDYTDCGDIRFPRKITMNDSGREIKLEFSSCTINSGLSESELSFDLPSNADRLTVKKVKK